MRPPRRTPLLLVLAVLRALRTRRATRTARPIRPTQRVLRLLGTLVPPRGIRRAGLLPGGTAWHSTKAPQGRAWCLSCGQEVGALSWRYCLHCGAPVNFLPVVPPRVGPLESLAA
jgi:hypothetical protein